VRIVVTMSSARPHQHVRPSGLRDDPDALRAVVALGMFSLAEHAVWVTVLVVAYRQGGVSEAGAVSAALLAPAALMAPLVAREMTAPDIRNPLAAGYALQTVTLGLAAAVLALDLDPLLFYMAGVLVTITTVFSRPAHHAFIAMRGATVAATVATGTVSGGAQLGGPLLSAAILTRFDVVHVFLLATLLLLAATAVTIRMPNGPALPTCTAFPSLVAPHPAAPILRDRPAESRRCILLLFALLGFVAVMLGTIETLATEVSFAANHTGASGIGVLLAATGGGLLVGGWLAGVIVRRASELAAMRIGSVVAGVALVAAGAPLGVTWSLFAFAAVGVGMQIVLVAGWLLLHRHVCRSNAAVVFGVLESQHLIGNAGGAAAAGLVMGHFGAWPVLVVTAVGLPASMLALNDDRVGRLSTTATIVGVAAAATSTNARTV
jgi:hypothetical protein